MLDQGKLIDKGFARRDMGLSQAGNTIHTVGQQQAMPVDTGVLRQSVGHKNPYPITLNSLYRRTRR